MVPHGRVHGVAAGALPEDEVKCDETVEQSLDRLDRRAGQGAATFLEAPETKDW